MWVLPLLGLLARLPERVLYALSGLLAFLLFRVVRYRRKTVRQNLERVFRDMPAVQRGQLEKEFYRYLADVVIEILLMSRLSREALAGRVEIVGMEHLRACSEKGQSAILLSAHQGNWEWMLAAVASASPRALDALYRPLHNPAMDDFFMRIRTQFGAHMIPAEKAARVILKLRRETRFFGILGDQNPRRKDEKYWATFMGVETPVVIGPERIARLTGYPLFYVATEKLQRGRYRCVIAPLLEGSYGDLPDGEISQRYMAAVEDHVRRQPACWMWSHQRWRYRRQDCPEYQSGLPSR